MFGWSLFFCRRQKNLHTLWTYWRGRQQINHTCLWSLNSSNSNLCHLLDRRKKKTHCTTISKVTLIGPNKEEVSLWEAEEKQWHRRTSPPPLRLSSSSSINKGVRGQIKRRRPINTICLPLYLHAPTLPHFLYSFPPTFPRLNHVLYVIGLFHSL